MQILAIAKTILEPSPGSELPLHQLIDKLEEVMGSPLLIPIEELSEVLRREYIIRRGRIVGHIINPNSRWLCVEETANKFQVSVPTIRSWDTKGCIDCRNDRKHRKVYDVESVVKLEGVNYYKFLKFIWDRCEPAPNCQVPISDLISRFSQGGSTWIKERWKNDRERLLKRVSSKFPVENGTIQGYQLQKNYTWKAKSRLRDNPFDRKLRRKKNERKQPRKYKRRKPWSE